MNKETKRQLELLRHFLNFMDSLYNHERVWLMDKFTEYFCDSCGEDPIGCQCKDKE
jgi:hypothetical protein